MDGVPPQAISALAWALVGPPLIVYAATRVRRGRVSLHAGLMLAWVAVELAVFASFGFVEPGPRRPALEASPLFRVHVALAGAAGVGAGWQLASRAVPRLRRLHRRSGPAVVAVWCAALWTGIYNFVFLYVW